MTATGFFPQQDVPARKLTPKEVFSAIAGIMLVLTLGGALGWFANVGWRQIQVELGVPTMQMKVYDVTGEPMYVTISEVQFDSLRENAGATSLCLPDQAVALHIAPGFEQSDCNAPTQAYLVMSR